MSGLNGTLLSVLLALLSACDFHFHDFHAVASTDAATPSTRDESSPASQGKPSGDAGSHAVSGATGDTRRDAAVAVEAGSGTAAPLDGGSSIACTGATALACACDPALCVAMDAGAADPGRASQLPGEAPPSAEAASTPPTNGMPPAAGTGAAPVAPVPVPGLRLRYDFAGQGATLQDRVADSHGSLLGGAVLDGSGSLTLDGSDDYAVVPKAALAALESVTVVAWISATSASCYQRVFDVGSASAAAGEFGSETLLVAELFLTTDQCPDRRVAAIARTAATRHEAQSPAEFARDRVVQLAVVADAARQTLTLYVDGVRANETGSQLAVSRLSGAAFWLGRSLWKQDPYARLRYDEFRLYDRALGADQVAELARRGADVP